VIDAGLQHSQNLKGLTPLNGNLNLNKWRLCRFNKAANIGQGSLPSVLYGANKMNMISTGAFLTEIKTSEKKSALVSELVSAWEKKNSKVARAGGVSLMALSLAACGSSDDTSDAVSYTQAQLDVAKTGASQTALTDSGGTVHADVNAAITSNDAAVIAGVDSSAAISLALRNAAAGEGVPGTSTMTDAELIVAITKSNDTDVTNAVDTSADDTAATNASVVALGYAGIATLAQLNTAYDALLNPAVTDFTLTTALNSGSKFVGSSGDDTYDATTANSLSSGDSLDGGLGTDTLTATLTTASIAFTSKDIEVFNITATTGDSTVDMVNVTGLTTFNSVSSTMNLTINNIVNIPAIGINSDGTTKTQTFNFRDSAMSSSTDDLTLTLNNSAGTIALTGQAGATNKIETVSIDAVTSASTVDDLQTTGVGTTALEITGAADLTITTALDNEIVTVAAGSATGDVTLTVGTGAVTATMGAGADNVTAGSGVNTISGGAGNDTINISSANLATTDSLAGGTGTDTVSFTSDITLADATMTALTGIEVLTASADMDLDITLGAKAATAGVTTINLTGDAASDTDSVTVGAGFTNNLTIDLDLDTIASATNTITATNYTGALTVKALSSEADQLHATITGGTGTSDKYEISLDANDTVLVNNVSNVETISFVDGDTANDHTATIATANANATYTSATSYQTLTIDGSALTTDALSVDAVLEVDAKVVIKGGGAADTLAGSASANFGDTITGGAGNDTITFVTGNFTLTDSVDGGAGTDKIKMTAADATVVDADFTLVTNVESIEGGSAAADLDVTLDTLADAAGIRTVNFTDTASTGDLATITAGFTSTLTIDLDTAASAASSVVASAYVGAGLTIKATSAEYMGNVQTITGSANTNDTLEISTIGNNTTIGNTGMTAFETVNIIDGATATNHTVTFTHADENAAYTNSSVYETVTISAAAIGASGDTVNINLSDETNAAVVATGGEGVNTITMSESANVGDVISAAGGNDTISSSATSLTAADTVDGGAGTDTLSFSADDTITDAMFTKMTNVEILTAASNIDLDMTLGALADAAGIRTITLTGDAASDTDSVTVGAGFTSALTIDLDLDTIATATNTITATNYTGALTVKALSSEADQLHATITGGTGSDTYEVSLDANDTILVDNVSKVETIKIIDGDTSNDHTATVTLADGNSVGTGAASDETVTVDGSALTTDILVASAAAEDDGKVVLKGGGAGDTLTASASANNGDTITGGAGNDTINFTTAGLTSADTVDGGVGTADVLNLTTDGSTVVDADFTNITNVETVTTTAGSQMTGLTLGALAMAAGVTKVVTNDSTAVDTVTIGAGFTNNLTVDFGAADTTGIDVIDGTAFTGVLTVTAAGTELDSTAATITGGTSLNDTLNVTQATDTILMTNITAVENIKTVGAAGNLTMVLVDGNVVSGGTLTIDASTMDGDILNVNAAAETDGNVSIIADGTGAHVAVLGQGNDTFSSTSTGADDVTLTAGSNTVTTGDGADDITIGTGADTVNSQAGDDLIYSTSANLGGTDDIDAGTGTDTLTMLDDSTVTDADFTKITNLETLTTAANKDLTLTLGANAASSGLATVTLAGTAASDTDTVTIGSGMTSNLTVNLDDNDIASAVNTVNATGYTGVLTVAAADDELDTTAQVLTGGSGTSDVLEVTLTSNDDTILLTSVTAFENINTKGALGNVTMTTVEGNVANGKTLTIDATSMDGDVLTFDGSAEGAATTSVGHFTVKADGTGAHAITLGNGNDTATLTGSGATTVTATAGTNSITTGTGADTITAGSGADTITVGTGGDTITFTSAANASGDSITDFISANDQIAATLDYSSLNAGVVVNLSRASAGVAGQTAAEATLSGERGEYVYDTTNSKLYINMTSDTSISGADMQIGVNAAATASATIGDADVNFTVTGTAYADTIVVGKGTDTITAGLGVDTIRITTDAGVSTTSLTEATGTSIDVIEFKSTSAEAVLINGLDSAGVDLLKIDAAALNLRNGSTDETGDTGYVEDGAAIADALLSTGANDTVIELTQNLDAATSTAIDDYQASATSTNLTALIAAIVASTGGGETFDGQLHSTLQDAGDKVVFSIDDGSESVLILYEAGAGAGTANATIEAAEVSVLAVFDGLVDLANTADI
jgi:hypothetical protein